MKFSSDKIENEFLTFCYEHYDAVIFDEIEFKQDIARSSMVKKLLNRYKTTGKINIRVILNHITILVNVFGKYPTNIILFYKIDSEYYGVLKPLLEVNNNIMNTEFIRDIERDENICKLIKNVLDSKEKRL